jgi:hypothetical protein
MKSRCVGLLTTVYLLSAAVVLARGVPGQDATANVAGSGAPRSSAEIIVPRLIKFSGTMLDGQNRPMAGPVGVTFALYAQESGGAALWMETQNVHPDANGNYTVLLGAASKDGVPAEQFASGEARWLGLQVENRPEHTRVLLVSVPYALKAHDAETLGGLPPSAFVTTAQGAAGGGIVSSSPTVNGSRASTNAPAPAPCAFNGAGTANFVPLWTGACSQTNSLFFQTGGNMGLGTVTPKAALDVAYPGAAVHTLIGNAGCGANFSGIGFSALSGCANYALLGDNNGHTYINSTSGGGAIHLRHNNAEQMTLTPAGLVGIGTGAPGAMLDVRAPNVINSPVAQFGSSVFGSSNSILVFNKFCPFNLCIPQTLVAGSTEMFLSGGPGTYVPGTIAGDGGLRVIASRNIFFGDSGHARMFLASNGNVGINTTTPSTRLTVIGNNVGGQAAILGQSFALPGTGVQGTAGADGTGVAGTASVPGGCGSLELCTATGVSGTASGSTFNVGVSGSVTGGGTGVQGFSDNSSGFGVQGTGPNTGVQGVASTAAFFAAGVWGNATTTTGVTRGVYGTSSSNAGIGVHGIAFVGGQFETGNSKGAILIGRGLGSTRFRVDPLGQVFADGGYVTGGADFAESFAVRGDKTHYEAGDLLAIDRNGTRRMALAQEPYSHLVAGIYSTKPGLLGTTHTMFDPELEQEVPLAVVGVVPCKVSAENGSIQPGDLLVTSSTPGFAMKGTNKKRMLGAVVGKALEPLPSGKGTILVLVTLQ